MPIGPYSSLNLSREPRPRIGTLAGAHPVYEAYQPTPLSLPNTISRIAADEGSPNQHIPVPPGMSLGLNQAHNQLQLALDVFRSTGSFGRNEILYIFLAPCSFPFGVFAHEQIRSQISPLILIRRRETPYCGRAQYICSRLYSGGVDASLEVRRPPF